MGVIAFVRARADRARREGFNDRGASAIEWALISTIALISALIVVLVVLKLVEDDSK